MAQLDEDYEITINNMSCCLNVGCSLNLQKVAENTFNVELRNNKITIRLRKPNVTVYVWRNGTIMCFGARVEEDARIGARHVARLVQKQGFNVKLRQLRTVNVLASCTLPFRVNILGFAKRYKETSYEPELHPAALYKVTDLKASLSIYASGIMTIVAPSIDNVHEAVKYIYPRLEEFRHELTAVDEEMRAQKRIQAQKQRLLLQ